MSLFERLQPLAILASALLGLALARIEALAAAAAPLVTPLLVAVIYATLLPIGQQQLGRALGHRKVTLASLGLNFVWTPLLAWGLGAVFLADAPDLRLGLLLLLVTPCTDWYVVFTGIARGDVALATALLPLNAILQLALLPLYVWGLAGSLVALPPQTLVARIALVFLLPLALAALTRQLVPRLWGQRAWQALLPRAETGQLLALNAAVAALFAAEGEALLQQPALLLRLLPPLGLFFALNWVLGQWLGRRLQLHYPEQACLSCTTLARNSPVALAIAASAFPHRPLVAIALAIGPLIELPVLALVSQALLRQRPSRP